MLWSFLHLTLVKISMYGETQQNEYAFLLLISVCISWVPMAIQRVHIWIKQGTENLSPPLLAWDIWLHQHPVEPGYRDFKTSSRSFGCSPSQHAWGSEFNSQQNLQTPNYSSVWLRVLRTPRQNWNSQIKISRDQVSIPERTVFQCSALSYRVCLWKDGTAWAQGWWGSFPQRCCYISSQQRWSKCFLFLFLH